MDRYFLTDGDGAVRGPFVMGQLRGMFERGEVSAAALVCLECEPGEELWESLAEMVERESADEARQREEKERQKRARAAYLQSRSADKSEGVAVILALLIVGAGHMYAGQVWGGVAALGLCLLLLIMGVWPLAAIIWLVTILDAPGAVRRWNDRI